jgi:uncharacterized cupredoxin-like copper-binding protein
MSRVRRINLLWMAVALVASLSLAACAPSTPAAKSAGAAPGKTGVQEITLAAREFGFAPAQVSLSAAQPVRLIFVNEGTVEHDITIERVSTSSGIVEPHSGKEAGHKMSPLPAGSVHASAHKGEKVSVDFTPKAGTYEVYCSIAGHKEAGMRGTLTVQ